jgi:heme-degrading monooxygenase HmoA
MMLHILWEYRVRPDRRREFEEHYRSDGTWAAFFRGGRGYRETILLSDREEPDRYLTIDVWTDLESYRAFSEAHAREYEEIDRRCAELTGTERCLGFFEVR